jgi:HK97 family phage portal protein
MYVLPSQVTEIVSGGLFEPVKEYTLQYNGTYRIPADAVCHIKDFNPYYDGTGSHLYGMSPLKAGLRSMTTNNEAITTGVKYLQNQTARGVLMSDEGDLTEVQAQQLKQKFKQTYQGSDNAGDVIITPKKLSWVNFGLNASDLSLIEQYNASIKDLCNIYNVPVQLLNNTDSSTYNNMKEAKKALYQNAVMPELIKIREELNRWLTPKYGEKLYIDFDFTVIPELQEEMDKVVDQMGKAWWITPNEKRAAMSYGIDEDNAKLDDYYVPANLMPISGEGIEIPEPKGQAIDYSELLKAQVPGLPNVYTTITEAVARARELGGEGYHSHLINGSTVFMPFETHEEFEAIMRGEYNAPQPVSDDEKQVLVKASFDDYPQAATNNARRMLEWREKYGRDEVKGGTAVGWQRANQLANREKLSEDVISRMAQFNRHRQNAEIDPKYKDEPWKDNGYVAWNLWGGTAGVDWAIKKIKQIRGE